MQVLLREGLSIPQSQDQDWLTELAHLPSCRCLSPLGRQEIRDNKSERRR